MGAAAGPMAVECGAAAKLYSTLTTPTAMKIGNVNMKPAEIKLYLQETDVNGRVLQSFTFPAGTCAVVSWTSRIISHEGSDS